MLRMMKALGCVAGNSISKSARQWRQHWLLMVVVVVLLTTGMPKGAFAQTQCNVCSAETNLACVSRTQFQICSSNALPSGPVNTCPAGYVCSTIGTRICQPDDLTVAVDCSNCNQCDPTQTFACTGARTYALCLGGTTPTELTGTCAPFHVCSIDYQYICGNETQGVAATCSLLSNGPGTITPTTTALPTGPIDAVAFCQLMRQNVRFPLGNDLSTTCRQYIYCFVNNGIWGGGTYLCPGSTFYNDATRLCDTQIPNRCLTTLQTLTFRNMDIN